MVVLASNDRESSDRPDAGPEVAARAPRPWPPGPGPWILRMRWEHLIFLHWPVKAAMLRPLVPEQLTIDTFEGEAWVGVVPFEMSRTRARLTPPIPGLSYFPELNVRTYVTIEGKPGVWFFSLDAASKAAASTITLPDTRPLMHYARVLDVAGWMIQRVA